MKKNKKLLLACIGSILMLSSCVTTNYMITDNPVGTKVGVAKIRMFGKDKDISIERAAKNGNITKIGTVEVRTTVIVIPFVKTTVTGE